MLIEAEHEALLRLRKRQYALEALVREIERVTRGETFDIHNDIRWVQMLDYRDKNIIDLASWAKGAYSKGGFLGQLQCHHLRSFGPERAWGNDEDMRGDNYDKTFSEARARLFPGCDGRKLQSTDFEALTTAFKAQSEPLVQDRHQNRAHIYEKNSAGTAKMLDHDESRRYFEYFQGVLNDLALVAFGAKWSLHDMNIMSSEADAQDLVDQLILTRQGRRKIDRGEIERDALYDALHADPHDRDGKPAFNSAKGIFNVLAKRGLVKPLSD